MKISAKGRYALAAMICMAQNRQSDEFITVASIADQLGISKIYLEQVYSLLKRAGLVNSVKGAQGGYQLSRTAAEITAYDILHAVELSLFEKPEDINLGQAPAIEETIKLSVLNALDDTVKNTLQKLSLSSLAEEADAKQSNGFMYYI